MNEPTSPEELAAILKREFEAADDYHDQIQDLQEAAFRYYEAQPFGNEVDGRSQIVLPDVQEVVDDTTAVLVEMFVSGDRTIEFEATNEEDEQAADDATAAIDYRFMREQDGYGVIHDVTQDGNLRKIGIFKALSEEEERVSRKWEEMPIEALGMIEESDGEIEDVREFEGMDEETGEPAPMVRVLIKRQTSYTCHKVVAVPTNEFRFNPKAKDEDTSPYNAHVRVQTRSDLVGMGFDPEQVYALPAHSQWEDIESDVLDYTTGETSSEALEEVLLCEEYARIDVDGDGIAELVKCFRVENEILRWADGELAVETVDEQPFSIYCPFPRAHRMVGYSLADKIMDIQLGRSEVARQLLDGMAFSNLPRPIVSEAGSSDETLDDLLNPIPGSPIRVKSPDAVVMAPNSFDVGKSLQAMEWFSREKEARSGSSRATPGADANTLNNLSATEFVGREDKGMTLQRFMARNLAGAFARACGKLYRQMRVEAEPFTIRVDGKYREVDPATWPERVNIRIRVGLGSGSKDKRIQARMMLLEPLTLALQEGMAGPEHAFNFFDGMARDTGIGQGDDFMWNPDDPEAQERLAQKDQEPSPEELEAQAESARKERELALSEAETERRLQIEQFKAERAAQLQEDKQAHEKLMSELRFQWESDLAERKAAWEAKHKADIAENKPGGRLDA